MMDNRGRTKREITVGDCGCRILQTTNGAQTATGMYYCPKHSAADAMYEALEFAKTEAVAITQCDEAWEPYGIALMIRDRAAAAIALADGPDA